MSTLNLADNTAEEILARALQSTMDKADYESKAAKRVQEFDADLSAFRNELSKRIKEGKSTGDHLYDMVIRHHGFENFNKIVEAYRDFEKRLAGRKGEYFLVVYTARVVFMHRMIGENEYRDEHCFRLGVLDGDTLIWHEDSGPLKVGMISVPVSRYVWGNHPPAKENIFVQHHGSSDPSPPLFGECVLGPLGLLSHHAFGSFEERSRLNEIVIGDKEVEEWIAKHPFHVGFGAKNTLKDAARALEKFDLVPMGPEDGPLPHGSIQSVDTPPRNSVNSAAK